VNELKKSESLPPTESEFVSGGGDVLSTGFNSVAGGEK
jgi:hypothetical protein